MTGSERNKAASSRNVKKLARAAGFDLVGIAKAEALDPTPLDRWLEGNLQADMEWISGSRSVRINPTVIAPWAKTVVSLAVNYYHPGSTILPGGGRISRFAWGRDYHKVLGTKLRSLRRGLREEYPHCRSWGGVDAVPIMQKVWAHLGGLGWIGKNGLLLTKEFGSWVFLATLLLDIELEPDSPTENLCGDCRRCIDSCPTEAIEEPGVVDAGRCLSYCTVEHKGELPAVVDLGAHHWLFGCDECQDACPWSQKRATPSKELDFKPRKDIMQRNAEEWTMSIEDFDKLTRGSSLRRAGRDGMVRNARAILR